jgi:hypothetical protein
VPMYSEAMILPFYASIGFIAASSHPAIRTIYC